MVSVSKFKETKEDFHGILFLVQEISKNFMSRIRVHFFRRPQAPNEMD